MVGKKKEDPKKKNSAKSLGFKKGPKECWDCNGTGMVGQKTCDSCDGSGER